MKTSFLEKVIMTSYTIHVGWKQNSILPHNKKRTPTAFSFRKSNNDIIYNNTSGMETKYYPSSYKKEAFTSTYHYKKN